MLPTAVILLSLSATITGSGELHLSNNLRKGYMDGGVLRKTTADHVCYKDTDPTCIRNGLPHHCCDPELVCRHQKCQRCSKPETECDSTPIGCCDGSMCGGNGQCVEIAKCLQPGETGCSATCCKQEYLAYSNKCVDDRCIGTVKMGKACDPANEYIKCESGSKCQNGVCKSEVVNDKCSALIGKDGCDEKCFGGGGAGCRLACDFATGKCAQPEGDCLVALGKCKKDNSNCCDGFHCIPGGSRGHLCAPCGGMSMARGAGAANCLNEYSKKGCEKCGGSCTGTRCDIPKFLKQ